MAHPNATKEKYRPVLTIAQISHIIALAKQDIMAAEEIDSSISISLLGVLAPFEAKIQNAGIQAAYTEKPTHQEKLIESLGGTLIPEGQTKEDYWHQCYVKFILTPEACTLKELEGAKEHKYLNDLMSPEEKALFESQVGELT